MAERLERSPEPVDDEAHPLPGVLEIVEQLAALAAAAPRVPWSSRAVVDIDELISLIAELRERLPADLHEAHLVLTERENLILEAEVAARDLLAEAEAEADRLVRQYSISLRAEERAARLTAESEQRVAQLLDQARRQTAEIRAEARADAEAQRAEADAYSLEVLRRIEAQLTEFVVSVRKGISSLEHLDNPR